MTLTPFGQGVPAVHQLTPPLDVKEDEKDIVLEVDLPGFDEKDINLTIYDGVLSLRGEKKSEHNSERENYLIMERSHGCFQRSIWLPDTIDEDKVEARFDKGVLTVTLPKRVEMIKAQKKIEIRGGQAIK